MCRIFNMKIKGLGSTLHILMSSDMFSGFIWNFKYEIREFRFDSKYGFELSKLESSIVNLTQMRLHQTLIK